MHHPRALATLVLLLCTAIVQAQEPVATNTNAAVPPLVNFSGTLTDVNNKPMTGIVGVTFLLYKDPQGGAPLWMETQNVQPDSRGRYTVMLGSTSSSGLLADIFVAGEAHWLGVQVAGQAEHPRVLLVSAPYALKAGDAQTLGGLPASAFVLAAPPNSDADSASSSSVAAGTSTSSLPPASSNVTTTGGTVNALPLFTTATNIQSSAVSQSGSGISAKIGIGTTAPATTLDIKGSGTVRGTLSLPATGVATASKGANSNPQTFGASVFNSTTNAAIPQTFQWQAEPVGNDTSAPSSSLNLLFASGTGKPAETGLHIANDGQITFATGQPFPGTGTVTSVATGKGLTGGPITTTGTLAIDPTVVPLLNTNDTFTGLITFAKGQTFPGAGTITGVTAGTDLTGGGTSGNVTLNVDTVGLNLQYPQLTANNFFTGTQFIENTTTIEGNNPSGVLQVTNTATSGHAPAIVGTTDSSAANAVKGIVAATSGTQAGIFGATASPTGFGVYGQGGGIGTYGAWSAPSKAGAGTTQTGVWGDAANSSSGTPIGVVGSADDSVAGYFFNNSPTGITTVIITSEGGQGAPFVAGTGTGGLFGTDSSNCFIDTAGDINCTGSKNAVIPIDGGSRIVALSAIESPKNWFEDFGSAQLVNGSAVVSIDSEFTQTVNVEQEYQVFLTPYGDCRGLYVTNRSANSFEVHELGGGAASVSFGYRITALRRKYENVRFADHTHDLDATNQALQRMKQARAKR